MDTHAHPLRILAPLAALLLTGCAGTFTHVKPTAPAPWPALAPSALVVGPVTVSDGRYVPELQAAYAAELRRGILDWGEEHAFAPLIITDDGTPVPADAVVITGDIRDIDLGDDYLRNVVGLGAGKVRVRGKFQVKDGAGKLLAEFKASNSYLGGELIGGPDMLTMDQQFRRFGGSIAASVDGWVKGKPLE